MIDFLHLSSFLKKGLDFSDSDMLGGKSNSKKPSTTQVPKTSNLKSSIKVRVSWSEISVSSYLVGSTK